jgi:hypothetical protein
MPRACAAVEGTHISPDRRDVLSSAPALRGGQRQWSEEQWLHGMPTVPCNAIGLWPSVMELPRNMESQ